MTSHQRRGSGPVRQHSLQQLPRRHHHHHHHHHHLHHQLRRQRSAEEDQSSRRCCDPLERRGEGDDGFAKRNARSGHQVRVAWCDDESADKPVTDGNSSGVEVVACQIVTSKARTLPNPRQPRAQSRTLGPPDTKNRGSLIYSRQELAERLRLAWKQREVNKSNIDVFLAHGTIEERSDSRLSSSSSPERSPPRFSGMREMRNAVDTDTMSSRIEPGEIATARSKRASFRSGANAAFSQPVNDNADLSSTNLTDQVTMSAASRRDISSVAMTEAKNRRTNSAPPAQRRNLGVTSPQVKTQVSIVIEAPRMSKVDRESSLNEPSKLNGIPATGRSNVKSATAKRRPKNPKKRANSLVGKDLEGGRAKILEASRSQNEVVTMVSLVSDAETDDSEIENNSPRDDKLINQLRNNLPTTPIIKSNAGGGTCSFNSISRRPIKSVSFQQDSIEIEEEPDKSRVPRIIRPRSVQVGRVTGSALPTPEEASSTWRTKVTSLGATTSSRMVAVTASAAVNNGTREMVAEISLTDREKRCLIVPIGDTRSDKKRKLLRTRSTPPQRVNDEVEKLSSVTRDVSSRTRVPETIEKFLPVHQPSSILLQTPKLCENVATRSVSDPEGPADEPAFRTNKEKECWHLYRRMCDKGVCVSFDTVLRGMLTPTEYRLRRKETS